MASKVINTILNLKDNFSKSLQNTTKNTKEFQRTMKIMKNSVKETVGNIRDSFGVVGIGAAGFLKSSLDSAAKFQQINADLTQTLKSTHGVSGETVKSISNMADKLSGLTTYSKGTIEQGQNMLLTFTNIGKKVFPGATSAMLDMATKMKQDLPHTAIQLGKALNDPVKGITALKKVGVTFTQSQTDVIKKLVETGHMATAQKVIIAELNREFGGQAQAATNTYTGKLAQMQNAFNNMKVSIGMELLPYMTKFIIAVSSGSEKIMNFVKNNKQLVTAVLAATAAFGTIIGGFSVAQRFLSILSPMADRLETSISGLAVPIIVIVGLITAFTLAYQKNFGGFRDFVNTVIKNVMTKIKELKKVLESTEFKNKITSALNSIKKVIEAVFNFIIKNGNIIKPVLAAIVGGFVAYKVATTAVNTAMGIWNGITKMCMMAQVALNLVMKANPIMLVITAIGALVGVLIYLWNTNKSFRNAFISIWNGIKSAIGSVAHFFSSAFSAAAKAVQSVFSAVANTFKGIINTVIGGLNFMIGALDKINVKVPKWIPGVGGKHIGFSIKKIPKFEKGTNYFNGGMALVGEKGAEVVNLPHGSSVTPNSKTNKLLGQKHITNKVIINMNGLTIREEADIDKIANKIVTKLEKISVNMA